MARVELPIDSVLPAIVRHLQTSSNLVIEAAPGAGKTTRVPPAVLSLVAGEVLVLEPRRIAARMAATRTAAEHGEAVGETVGFQVRFEEAAGPRTRLRFVTEGILTRRLISDPELRGVDAVILDEFHERHLDTDLALALLRGVQRRRPALRLVVMSATLESAPVARFLGDCPVVRSEGRAFPLTLRYTPYDPRPLEVQVRQALTNLLREIAGGHVLVFLPGAAEIRRALRECAAVAQSAGVLLLPLHGDLSSVEQDRAVAPSKQRRVILSTNLSESSVTIEDVRAVVDSGLARVASTSPWTGLPTLEVRRISQASAAQRAGRAGRTGPGVAVRLYAEEDLAQRPRFDTPEILRADLAGLCLGLRAMGFASPHEIDWLEPPPAKAVEQAEYLLDGLGAKGEEARALARLPLPPRLARVVLSALERGVGEDGIAAAALLGSGTRSNQTDLLSALDEPPDARALQQRQQLRRLLRAPRTAVADDDALLMAVLRGFPDRVAQRREGKRLLLANGISAEIGGEPPAYGLMVVLDAEDRSERQLPAVRLTARVEPDWLFDFFPERFCSVNSLEWNRTAERVEAVSTLRYGELILEESRNNRPEATAAAAMLAEAAVERGLGTFVEEAALGELLARVHFADLPEPDVAGVLRTLCDGLRSFAELREAARQLLPMLEGAAGPNLRKWAPATWQLSGGRQTRVHYEDGKPPWIASRLQDFFGLRETPRLGRSAIPVVVHLLAPNQRPVQTTTDLAGFWERLYPQVRRELMRRYPRHAWPEHPQA